MPYHIWRLAGDEMTIIQGTWINPELAATNLAEQTGVYHVAVAQGSVYDQLLQEEKEQKEQPSPVSAQPEAILFMIEQLEASWQGGAITFEECSRQQQRWYRLLAQVDGR